MKTLGIELLGQENGGIIKFRVEGLNLNFTVSEIYLYDDHSYKVITEKTEGIELMGNRHCATTLTVAGEFNGRKLNYVIGKIEKGDK